MNGLISLISGMIPTHDINTWIPQRSPFVFIDTIVEVSAQHAITQYTVSETCPLMENGCLSLAGLMENAAQSCAVRAGFSGGNRIGYIGAIKQMKATRLPKAGERLTTEVLLLQEVLNISLIECKTRLGEEIIATTTLKLAIID